MPQLFPNIFNLSALNGVNGFVLNGITSGDKTGFSVSNAGDVNGDGVNDIILGTGLSPSFPPSDPGYAAVVFGQKGYYPPSFELASLNGTQGFRIKGVDNEDETGIAVSGAGDVNGDGIDDVLVGAPFASPHNLTHAGSVFVVFGQRAAFPGELALSDLTGSNGFRINGFYIDFPSILGATVSGAGDVNGDGLADILLGVSGRAWVVFGKRFGFPAVFELGQVDGHNGFELYSNNTHDDYYYYLSRSCSHADVNGDGLSDVIIGATSSPNSVPAAGSVFVVFGSRAPFPANFSMSTLNGSNGFRVNGVDPYDHAGAVLSSAGDFNGDGVEDFVVGSDPMYRSSSVFLVYGRRAPFPAAWSLSALNGSNGFWVKGIDGFTVTLGVGDFNGDGLSDLLLGVPQDSDSTQVGMAAVVFGQRAAMVTPLQVAALDGSNGFRLYGVTLGDQMGESVSTAGDFNGDGIDDILIGAPEASPGGRNNSGAVYMVYGDRIQWLNNEAFLIHQNETLKLETRHLNASVPGRWDYLNFQVENLVHGQFEYANQRGKPIQSFSYEELSQGQVLFKHDGSGQAPQFGFRASHVLASSNISAVVAFGYEPPILLNNSIALLQGQNWTLSPSQLRARAYLEGNTPTLQFSILGAEHLQFSDKASHQNLNGFSQEAVAAGNVVATHDGSPHAPTYRVAVSDGFNQVGAEIAQVYFTGRPYLSRNHYEIYSQTRLLISNSSLAAYDPSTVLLPLLFKIENMTSGGFIHAQTEKPVAQFTPEDINQAQIYFQPDNSSTAPRFAVVVSNGVLSSEPQMAEVNYIIPTPTPTTAPTMAPTRAPTMAPTTAPTMVPTMVPTMAPTSAISSGSSTALRDGLIGGGVAAAAVLGLGLGWMYKRYQKRNRQSEGDFNRKLAEGNRTFALVSEMEQLPVETAVPTFKV